MVELRLLGTSALWAEDGREASLILARHKLLALFCYLCLAGRSRFLRRETVLAALWPESDQAHARSSLRQALHRIRGELGAVIEVRGDELRVDPAAVRCDVSEFEDALGRGDEARALDLYGGELLDGFHLNGAPEFERWLDDERDRLKDLARDAALRLSDRCEVAGELGDAIAAMHQALGADPYNETVLRRLMVLLDRNGDRSRAIHLYRQFQTRLQNDLDLPPSDETRTLAQSLRGSAAAGVSVPVPEEGESEPSTTARPPTVESSGQPLAGSVRQSRRLWRWAAVATGALALVSGWIAVSRRPAGVPPVLAVLPFENLSADLDDEYFSDGVSNDIITQLSLAGLSVISRTSVRRYVGSTEPLQAIAEELGASHILEGSIQRSGGRVHINVQLIAAASDRHLWANQYDRPDEDIFGVQRDVAEHVARALELRLSTAQIDRLRQPSTDDIEAYNLYLQGRYLWHRRTRRGMLQSLTYFHQAIQRDPGYAQAYAGLADAYGVLGLRRFLPEEVAYRLTAEATDRALALDSTLPEGHLGASFVAFAQEWDYAAALSHTERAIQLNPNLSLAHHYRAYQLLTGFGDLAAAITARQRAVELDPLAPVLLSSHAFSHYLARNYGEAEKLYRQTLDIEAAFEDTHAALGRIAGRTDRPNEAIDHFREEINLYPERRSDLLGELAAEYAAIGESRYARELIEEARAGGAGSIAVALAYASLDEPDSVFAALDRRPFFEVIPLHTEWMAMQMIAFDPRFDGIREDPRFELLRRRLREEYRLLGWWEDPGSVESVSPFSGR